MKLVYNATVKNGKFHIYRRKEFLDDVLRMFSNREVRITVEKHKKSRSLEQNAYYWGVVVPMVKEGLLAVGYKTSRQETHDFLREKFLQKEIINPETGEVLGNVAQHTPELSTSEFMDFMAEIQQWAAEYLNIEIPDPGEQVKIEFT